MLEVKNNNSAVVCCFGNENDDDSSGHPVVFLYKERTHCPYCNQSIEEIVRCKESQFINLKK